MTDSTHRDSGITTSSEVLAHYAEIALMYEELRAAIDGGHESMTHADALAEISAMRAENATLQLGYDAARLEIDHLRGATKSKLLALQRRRLKASMTLIRSCCGHSAPTR